MKCSKALVALVSNYGLEAKGAAEAIGLLETMGPKEYERLRARALNTALGSSEGRSTDVSIEQRRSLRWTSKRSSLPPEALPTEQALDPLLRRKAVLEFELSRKLGDALEVSRRVVLAHH